MANVKRVEEFTAAYGEALTYYVTKNPSDYGYGVDKVPVVVAKMVPAYVTGTASIGPAMKRAMKALGIPGGVKNLRVWLNEEV